MAWELEIHTIDVGQGESSLIIARDAGQGLHRTMLIDGGEKGYAARVHDYVATHLGRLGIGLDHILLSHYDEDHSDGILALLQADNWTDICATIAIAAAEVAEPATTKPQRAAFAACGAMAVMLGAYDLEGGADDDDLVEDAVDALKKVSLPKDVVQAAVTGITQAVKFVTSKASNPTLASTTKRRNLVARAAAEAALVGNGNALKRAVRQAVFDAMGIPPVAAFDTRGLYATTTLIDIGDPKKTDLDIAVSGYVVTPNAHVRAPGIDRVRAVMKAQDLGTEILWGLPRNAAKTPQAKAPAVFLVATATHVWNTNGTIPWSDNNEGIAVIVRFNQFFYYTGGDIEIDGEDLIVRQLMGTGLPDPAHPGMRLPVPHRIACFKCGHHGSKHSTSTKFLNLISPVAALISSGGQHGHPEQDLVNRLQSSASLLHFYLTNCGYLRTGIPASNSAEQLSAPGNKSRVAGGRPLHDPARSRGNLVLLVYEIESGDGSLPERKFSIHYFEGDKQAFAHLPVGSRTEELDF